MKRLINSENTCTTCTSRICDVCNQRSGYRTSIRYYWSNELDCDMFFKGCHHCVISLYRMYNPTDILDILMLQGVRISR